jgi:hypothetical protein
MASLLVRKWWLLPVSFILLVIFASFATAIGIIWNRKKKRQRALEAIPDFSTSRKIQSLESLFHSIDWIDFKTFETEKGGFGIKWQSS